MILVLVVCQNRGKQNQKKTAKQFSICLVLLHSLCGQEGGHPHEDLYVMMHGHPQEVSPSCTPLYLLVSPLPIGSGFGKTRVGAR